VHYVYILKSIKDNNIYTGYSSSLKLRVKEHLDGKVASTRYRRPLKLVYYEAYLSEDDARAREKYLKGGGKAKKILKVQIADSLLT
jgi:putative endonuclease